MTNRVYDSSFLTARKAEKAIANSFLSPYGTAPTRGSLPLMGIKDSSILYAVKTGGMTEYTRLSTRYSIDPGVPYTPANTVPLIDGYPGLIGNIMFTVGSIIISWTAPTGSGPFSYIITPYLNGVPLQSVTSPTTTYRFTTLQDGLHYTFVISAVNAVGTGGTVESLPFMAPPEHLSSILAGTTVSVDVAPCMMYILNTGLNNVFSYTASVNMDAPIASRFMYLWTASVVQAWNWVTVDRRIAGAHDGWDWTTSVATQSLSECDAIIWLGMVIDYVTSVLVPTHVYTKSIYVYSAADVARVKVLAQWDLWSSMWINWYAVKLNDGYVNAITTMPLASAIATIPVSATPITATATANTLVVDGVTVSPKNDALTSQWTRLTVQGTTQQYISWLWDSVASTCLTAANEQEMAATVAPVTGAERDAEIDEVLSMSHTLTDDQKVQAEFWNGSISAPHMCIWLWKEYVRTIGCDCPTIMYSLLDLAIHLFEIGRVVWGIKTIHMQARPIQEIRQRYAGQQIASWNTPSTIDGAQWVPYQCPSFVTPPFPEFVSGHSGFTKGFSLTMQKWFGSAITKQTITYDNLPLIIPLFKATQSGLYGDFVVGAGASLIQAGKTPAMPSTISLTTWDDVATMTGISRLYGGIHTMTSHVASQTIAIEVDGFIGTTWGIKCT